MTLFIAIAALLVALTLALLLPPLLRRQAGPHGASAARLTRQVLRDQLAELEREQAAGRLDPAAAAQERRELERRVLEETGPAEAAATDRRRPGLAAALVLGLPLLAAGLYWQLGTPAALRPAPAGGEHALTPQQIESMVGRLAERLQTNPLDASGWLMLARSYGVLGRYPEAAAAFGRAVSLLPPDAGLLADYADVLAMAQGRRLAGQPERIIDRALELDPRHVKALALSGSAAFERGDYGRAIARWRQALAVVPAESGVAQGMQRSIADAEARLAGR